MIDTLFQRYKSYRQKYSLFYENEIFHFRHKPINILQVGVENSIPVWHKYLQRSTIYCIDEFDRQEPKKFYYLNNDRTYWARCDTDDESKIKKVMKEVWNNPRFDVIIDSSNNFGFSRHKLLKRYCIGKYYIEDGDDVRIMK